MQRWRVKRVMDLIENMRGLGWVSRLKDNVREGSFNAAGRRNRSMSRSCSPQPKKGRTHAHLWAVNGELLWMKSFPRSRPILHYFKVLKRA